MPSKSKKSKVRDSIEAVIDGAKVRGILVTFHGKSYAVLSPCDQDGRDFDGDGAMPDGFKIEASYKDGEFISLIQELSKHPKARYHTGRDEDGDRVRRVVFLLEDCDNWQSQAKVKRDTKARLIRDLTQMIDKLR
jgi:hypothetical protein